MSKLHYLTALLLIILLAIASGRVFESFEISPILRKEVIRHDPDYFLQNFTATTMNNKGIPAYQVTANYLEHYPDDDSMTIKQPLFSFYKNNIKTWTAQANEAVVSQQPQIIHLTGDVILTQILTINKAAKKNTPSIILTAKQLTIEPEQQIAHTTSQITLSKGKNQIQAIGMRADMNQNKIEFLAKTRSHYVLPAK